MFQLCDFTKNIMLLLNNVKETVYCICMRVYIVFVTCINMRYLATRCCGPFWLNGKESKEKAHVTNIYSFTILLGMQYLLFHCLHRLSGLLTLEHAAYNCPCGSNPCLDLTAQF